MEIKINVPENCVPAMVTVVYRFHGETPTAELYLPTDKVKLVDKPSKNNGKPTVNVRKYVYWTADKTAYLMANYDKIPIAEIAQHVGFSRKKCKDKYLVLTKGKAAGETIPAAPEPPADERWSTDIREKPSFMDSVKNVFSKKEFQVPADFNPSKPIGVNSYVYHAPAREMGRVVTVDMQRQTVLVDFNGTAKKFTLDAAKAMHKEMIARSK